MAANYELLPEFLLRLVLVLKAVSIRFGGVVLSKDEALSVSPDLELAEHFSHT